MAEIQVLAEQRSDISSQGESMIRNRIPTPMIVQAGGVNGDAIDWQLLTDGNMVWFSGVIVKGGARGRQAPKKTGTMASAGAKPEKKTSAKKGSTKKGTGLVLPTGKKGNWASDVDSAFGEEVDPFAPVQVAKVKALTRPKKLAAPVLPQVAPTKLVIPPARSAKGKGPRYDIPSR